MPDFDLKAIKELSGPILITGHTGFKGAWLSLLLKKLDVPLVGYSLKPEPNSLYRCFDRGTFEYESFQDIRDYKKLEKFVKQTKPSAIVHLAAQSLVLNSYDNPYETFTTNTLGTLNILDIGNKSNSVQGILIVTTDKVYENKGEVVMFREGDALKGKDPYSASKVAAEASVVAWQKINQKMRETKIVSARAGNVIGGGDLSSNRLIPDLIRGIIEGKKTIVRNPQNTRPWQHVLEPLYGYLMYLNYILRNDNYPDSLNFGPLEKSLTVENVQKIFLQEFNLDDKSIVLENSNNSDLESRTLNLNSELAIRTLGWSPKLNQVDSIKLTANWWIRKLKNNESPERITEQQISDYVDNFMQK